MLSVLIADDERKIREGIKQLVDWDSLDIRKIDTAVDGQEAYEKIRRNKPNIVIADIKMPGINGLQLIERVKRDMPEVFFVILSGYDEFDFARTAMKYGVRHYILKPSDENEIIAVLKEIVSEIERAAKKKRIISRVKRDLKKTLPLVKEQFFRDCLSSAMYSESDISYYRKLFGIDEDLVQLVILQFEGAYDLEALIALKKICAGILNEAVVLTTLVKDSVFCLIRSLGLRKTIQQIMRIQEEMQYLYEAQITVAISEKDHFCNIKSLYSDTREYLGHKFYLGKGSIITSRDLGTTQQSAVDSGVEYDLSELVVCIRCGDIEKSKQELDLIIHRIKEKHVEKKSVIAYLTEMLLAVIRQSNSRGIEAYLDKIVRLQSSDTLQEAEGIVREIVGELAFIIYNLYRKSRNRLVQLLMQRIDENIGNAGLTLKLLAKTMVYANVDYLSRLFKRETGKKFSQYLMEKRIEMAKKLLMSSRDERIYEIADRTGFGENSQYFSYTFKKITGLSPTEFREKYKVGQGDLSSR